MSAHVLLNLLNELGKSDKMQSSGFANNNGADSLHIRNFTLVLAYWKVLNLHLLQAKFQFSSYSL